MANMFKIQQKIFRTLWNHF